MNIEINTTEKTLIIKGLIAFSELIEFIKSKGFEDYSLKSEITYSTLGGNTLYPNNGLIGGTINTIPCHGLSGTVIDNNLNGLVTNCNTKL